MTEPHSLLKRQLKRLGLVVAADAHPPPNPAWAELLERVSRAYEEHDQERYLLERSQELASQETAQLYAALRAEHEKLEARVRERTLALQVSEGRLSSLLSLSADWVWEQDADLRFTYVSEGIQTASNIDPAVLIGHRRTADRGFVAQDDEWDEYQVLVTQRRAYRDFTYSYAMPGETRRYIRVSGAPVFDEDGVFTGYRGVGRDVTVAVLAEQKVHELARFDSLTGLPNRSMFLLELERAIARSARTEQSFAVCFMDLDRFKTINDTLGHAAGDVLLKTMAVRLREAVRGDDVVARLGGDEFVLLLECSGGESELAALAAKLLNAVGQPVDVQGCDFLVTASMGICRYPADGEDAATLLKHADAAMYLAKEHGKNNAQFYTSKLAEQAAHSFELESALRLALVRNELLMHYQPKINLASGLMTGMEALVRWRHPTRGMVSPQDFIPLAEERGLIVPLGRWVMRAVCHQIQTWQLAGLHVPRVALNLSARQFADGELVNDLHRAINDHQVLPCNIEVELTESVLMNEPERANGVLRQISSMGVSIAIDDFGTGYSSLSYLKRFPADSVKIDRSFVKGLPNDKDDTAITQAVIAMAHSLGLNVVAEGVETENQLDALRGLGCDEAQGYLLGRPMPADEVGKRLSALLAPIPVAA
jgi:diguanylate cyclase (GGDEF)-like protein